MRTSSYPLSFFLAFLILAPIAAYAQAGALPAAQLAEFDAFVQRQMAADDIPAISIGYLKNGSMWTKAYGFADVENKTPARAESMFRMASVTKPMTAAAVLQLAEQGKIDLDAEVQKYVPYFPKKNFPVTVRQLLGHLGGISHYKNYQVEGRIKERKTTREAIAIFENFDLIAEPGTRYSYSSYGYNLLGAVIEGASGMPYGRYMTENIWKPLGMNSTVVDDPSGIIPNRIRGYVIDDGKLRNAEFVDISSRFSAGGIRSNVHDMLRFGDGFDDGKVLSRASLDLMFNSMVTKSGELTQYSAGWGVNPANGRFLLSHSGGQQETSTYLFVFPTRKLTIAVASNLEGANTQVFAMRLFELLTGEAAITSPFVSGDRNRVPLIQAMQGVFEVGRGHFEKTGSAMTSDPKEIADAFAVFNQTWSPANFAPAKLAENFRKVGQMRNAANGPFIKMGSYMAARLKEKYGPERLLSYSTGGAITFFNDYNTLDLPKEFKLDDGTSQIIAGWQAGWQRTNIAAVRNIEFGTETNFEAVGAVLRAAFQGSEAYPNLSGQMFAVLEDSVRFGNVQKALTIADLSVELYPGLAGSHAYQGVILSITGEKEKARAALKRSIDFNANGLASAASLNNFAYRLERVEKRDAAIELLLLAIELHPTEANLYDTIGEFYLRKDMKQKAVEFYQKAVDTNPTYPNAAKAREILKQLSATK